MLGYRIDPYNTVRSVIIYMNDITKRTREQIAQWLRESGNDFDIPVRSALGVEEQASRGCQSRAQVHAEIPETAPACAEAVHAGGRKE